MLSGWYQRILEAFVADCDTVVGDVSVLDRAEEASIAETEWGPEVDIAEPLVVPDAVVAQVAMTPDVVALVSSQRDVSYREFGARVATLARQLIGLGVGPDTAVVVSMPRSVGMVVGIHAVVAAGGQYVPIDVNAPGRPRCVHGGDN